MAGLKFDVQVDFEKVVQLKEKIESVKKSIDTLLKAGDDRSASSQIKTLNKLQKEYENLSKKVIKSVSDISNSGKELDPLDRSFQKITTSLIKLGSATASLSLAKNLTSQIIKVRSEFESLESSFDVLLGGKGTKAFTDALKQFATDSPLSLSGVSDVAKTLLGFNIEAEKVVPIIKQLGDISMGSEQQFQSLALAFAQMSSTGKLMGQDLNQMINAGFNPLQEISRTTGRSLAELKKEMEAGAISADMVAGAFSSATSEGGKFYGMTQRQAEGLRGLEAQLTGAIEEAFNEIGASQQDIIEGGYKLATSLVQNYEKIGEVLMSIVAGYGAYKASVVANIAIEQAQAFSRLASIKGTTALGLATDILKAKTLALNATMLANPYVLIGAAVATLVYGLYNLVKAQNSSERAQKRLNEYLKEASDIKDDIISSTSSLTKILKDETQTLYAQTKAWDELNKKIPKAFEGMTMDEFKTLSDEEIQLKVNIFVDEKEFSDLENKIKETEKRIAEYNKLYIGNTGALGQASLNKLNEEKALLDELIKKQKELNETRQKAEFDSKPISERINIYNDELKALEKQRGEIEKVITSTKSLSNINFSFDWRNMMNIAQLENVNRRITELKTNISSLGDTQVVLDKKNEAYWTKQRDDALTILKSLEKGDEGWGDAEKKLRKAENELKAWDFSTKTTTKTTTKETTKEERESQIKAIEDSKKAILQKMKEVAFEVRQEEISLMDEGTSKVLAQIDLDYDKRKAEILKKSEELLKAQQDIEKKQWENDGKKGAFAPKTTSLDQMPEVKDSTERALKLADEIRVKGNKEVLSSMLEDVKTYEQQRLDVIKEFEDKRKFLQNKDGSLKQGVTKGNIEELNLQESDILGSIDQEFAQREETYNAWMSYIGSMTLEQLQSVLSAAEIELEKVQKANPNSNSVAVARAKVDTLKQKVSKAQAESELSPGKKWQKDWIQLSDSIKDADDSLADIEDQFQGTAKDIIKTARTVGQAAVTIIDGIVNLSLMSAQAMQTTATGAAAAIATVEKASVILAIISAALMVVTQLFSLFSKKDAVAAFNKELANLNDELAKTRLNARIGNDERESIFGEDSWAKAIDNIYAAKDALDAYNNSKKNLAEANKEIYKGLRPEVADRLGIKNEYKDYEDIIKNIQVRVQHKTLFRGEKNTTLGELTNLYNQDGSFDIGALKAFRDSEMWKDISEENRKYLGDMIDGWDSYQEALKETTSYLSDLFGDLGMQMSDSLISAFVNGTDAAKDFTDSAGEMLENLAKQIVYTVAIAPAAEKAQKQVLDIMGNEGLKPEEKFAQMSDAVDTFVSEVLQGQSLANDIIKQVQDSAKAQGFDIFKQEESDSSNSLKDAYAKASEESVTLLAGYTAAVRIILENMFRLMSSWSDPMKGETANFGSTDSNSLFFGEFAKGLTRVSEINSQIALDVSAIRFSAQETNLHTEAIRSLTQEFKTQNQQIIDLSESISSNTGKTANVMGRIDTTGVILKGTGLGL